MSKIFKSSTFDVGNSVEVTANRGDIFHDFLGTVAAIKDHGIITVRDQDDDCFDVSAIQCAVAKETR